MKAFAAFIITALLGAAPAFAQFGGERRGGSPGDFDFYVLALSWSPGFCELEGDRRGRSQCNVGARLGFVLHGLWPQFNRGFPSECGVDRQPTRMAMEQARGVFPEEGLARYQWRKHGSCSGLSPDAYFRAAAEAKASVAIPQRFRDMRFDDRIQAIEIERAFVAANPGLRADMVGVVCRRGVLQEVRVCLDRNLKGFRACPEVGLRDCRGEINMPAAR